MNIQNQVRAADPSAPADAETRMQVSAMIDGELDAAAADAVLDAVLASESLARFWLHAHCAGDWMRSDDVVGVVDDELALQHFSSRLALEPAIVAPKAVARLRSAGFWMRTGLPGASIAAALIAVAWVATPSLRGGDGRKDLATASDVSNVVVAKAGPAVVSDAPSTGLQMIDPDRLSPYLAAHRDVTPFAYRGPSVRPAAFNAPASALSAPQ